MGRGLDERVDDHGMGWKVEVAFGYWRVFAALQIFVAVPYFPPYKPDLYLLSGDVTFHSVRTWLSLVQPTVSHMDRFQLWT